MYVIYIYPNYRSLSPTPSDTLSLPNYSLSTLLPFCLSPSSFFPISPLLPWAFSLAFPSPFTMKAVFVPPQGLAPRGVQTGRTSPRAVSKEGKMRC